LAEQQFVGRRGNGLFEQANCIFIPSDLLQPRPGNAASLGELQIRDNLDRLTYAPARNLN
jgi:hypothetical protein